MPIADTESHEIAKRTGEEPYGCYNKEYADGYWAPDGVVETWRSPDGKRRRVEQVQVWVPHTMSKGCRADRSLIDPRCEGCKYRGMGEANTASVELKAALSEEKKC